MPHGCTIIPHLKMSATTIQREYLRNAQKAIRVASAVKFNVGAYNAQVRGRNLIGPIICGRQKFCVSKSG